MHHIVTKTVDTEITEDFIIPDNFSNDENLSLILTCIRDQMHGYWSRVQRTLVKSIPFYSTLRKEYKYIVLADTEGNENLFIFSKTINHDCMNLVAKSFVLNNTHHFQRVVSAGFTDLMKCYGKSETLKKESREKDTALLQFCLEK